MTKKTVTDGSKLPKKQKPSATYSIDTPFTIKFGLLLALLISFVLPVVLLSPLILAKILGYPLAEYIGMTADNFGTYVLVVQVIGSLICLGIIAGLLKHSGNKWSAVGLKKFNIFKGVRYIVGYYLIFLGLVIVFAIVASSIGVDAPSASNNESGGSGLLEFMGGFWLTFALTVVVAPIIEEVVFRGVLFPAIKKRYGLIAGVVVSSLIFMLVHINPLQMINALPLGMYLAVMYQKTGSIYPGIILHASWNFLVLMIATLAVQA